MVNTPRYANIMVRTHLRTRMRAKPRIMEKERSLQLLRSFVRLAVMPTSLYSPLRAEILSPNIYSTFCAPGISTSVCDAIVTGRIFVLFIKKNCQTQLNKYSIRFLL